MNCLLVAATSKEISPFIAHYRKAGNRQDIDILITGIGLMATTYSLLKQVSLKRPGLVIQAGIAGSFDKNLLPGSVVVVKQDTVADMSVMESKQLKTMFDLGLMKKNDSTFQRGWLINPYRNWILNTGLKPVRSISVNHITTSKQMIGFYRDKFNPDIESMEGSALHYVCLQEKIPFVQIRSISNDIGDRNKKNWKIKEAISNLNNKLIEFL